MNSIFCSAKLKQQMYFLLSSEGLRFLKYCVVGVINTGAGYGFFCAYIYLGLHYSVAGLMSLVTGVFFNYFVTRRFVFDCPTKKHTFFYYIATYGLLYLFSLALAWILIDVVHFSPYLAGLLSLPINALFSYALLRIIVFR
ncbi:MAG: GtrA family protein [Geobacteraceae bacterium]|nr:GtrA family protein [Geobacteraceae bacterium]